MKSQWNVRSIHALLAAVAMATGVCFDATANSPQNFTYQGRMMDVSGTTPLTGLVDFNLRILDPSGSCLLYEEIQNNVDLGTTGLFALSVGSPVGNPKRTASDLGLSMSEIFANPTGAGVLVPNSATCSLGGGYTPSAGDIRLMQVTVDGTTLTPNMTISAVPQATVAETLQGLAPSGFIQVSGNVSQANLATLTGGGDASSLHHHDTHNDARYARVGGAATQNFGSSNIVTTGRVGIGTSSPDADLEIRGTNPQLRMTATAGGTSQMDFYSSTDSMVRASIQGSDSSNVLNFFTGGVQALQLDANQNANFAGHLIVAGTIRPGIYDNGAEATLIAGYLTPCAAACKGTTWVDSEDNVIKYWDGANVQAIGTAAGSIGPTLNDIAEINNSTGSITMIPSIGNSVIVNQTTASLSPTSGALIVHGGAGIAGSLNVAGSMTSNSNITAAAGTAADVANNYNSPDLYLSGNYWDGAANAIDRWSITNVLGAGANPTSTLTFAHPAGTSGDKRYSFMDGNVGIGTASPSSRLDVAGGNMRVVSSSTNSSGAIGDSGRGAVEGWRYGGVGGFFSTQRPTTDTIDVALVAAGQAFGGSPTAGNGTAIGIQGYLASDFREMAQIGSAWTDLNFATRSADLRFYTVHNGGALNERLRVSSEGNVGVGTASPTDKLSVIGQISIDNTDGGARGCLRYTGTALEFSNDCEDATPTWTALGAGGSGLSGMTAGRVQFAASATTLGDSANLFWDSTNNRLGIGTASPSEALQVNGNLRLASGSVINFGGGGGVRGATTGGGFVALQTNATDRLHINFGGNVGVGTISPTDKLSVIGQISIDDTDGGARGCLRYTGTELQFSNDCEDATPTWTALGAGGGGLSGMTAGRLQFAASATTLADSTNLVWDNTNGRLGIGTAAPAQNLEVRRDDDSPTIIQISNSNTSANARVRMVLSNGSTPLGAINFIPSTNAMYLSNFIAGSLNLETAGQERLTIDSIGRVGIGTVNPGVPLEVNGPIGIKTSSSANDFTLPEQSTSSLFIQNTNSSGNDLMSYIGFMDEGNGLGGIGMQTVDNISPTSKMYLYTRGTDGRNPRITIETNGNVGVGTASPTDKLSVIGQVSIDDTDGGARGCLRYTGTALEFSNNCEDATPTWTALGAGGGLSGMTSGRVQFAASATTLGDSANLVWDNANGRLGISTAAPTAAFQVGHDSNHVNAHFYVEDVSNKFLSVRYDGFYYMNLSEKAIASHNNPLILSSEDGANSTILFNTNGAERVRIDGSGRLGVGNTSPTAHLHLPASTTSAESAPLKFAQGTLMTAAEAGAIEYDGTNLYFTDSTNARRTIATTAALGNYLLADGSVPLTANWDVGDNKITNLKDPTNNQDAATRNYVTTVASGYLPLVGGTMTGSMTGRASTTAAETAPIYLQQGALMSTPEAGAIEYDGTSLYYTDSTNTRRTLSTGSGSSQWTATGSDIYYSTGGVAIGATSVTSGVKLDISGNLKATGYVQVGSSATCDASAEGALVTSSGILKYCDGNSYAPVVTNSGTTISYGSLGGVGSRGWITATSSVGLFGGGTAASLLDGAFASGAYFANGLSASSHWIEFDFGIAKQITEIKWYQSNTTSQGTWKLQGSPDASSWTDIGSSFTLGGVLTTVITEVSGNTDSYRYYRLQGVSGTTSSSPWLHEIEFKVSGPFTDLWAMDTGSNNIHYTEGNVGVGTTSPSAKLDVEGTVKLGASGAVFSGIKSHVVSLDFPSTGTSGCNFLTVELPEDGVIIGVHLPSAPAANTYFVHSKSPVSSCVDASTWRTNVGNQQIGIAFENFSGSTLDPAAADFTIYYIAP